MARCIGCHLERQLGPLPVQGHSVPDCLCPRCSKDLDRSLGILDLLGLEIIVQPIGRTDEVAPRRTRKDPKDT